MMRIAQIGCGYWGPNLLRCLHALSDCQVFVAEVSEKRRKYVEESFPGVATSGDWNDYLHDRTIDAAVIATPAGTHYALAKAFLSHGKHVLVEKPLALTLCEAEELAELAKQSRLVLMTGHTFLYNPAVTYLKQYLASLGSEPYYFYSQRLNLGIVRNDVNVWWNLAPHDLSILLYLRNGAMPKSISVQGMSFLQPGIEDVAHATLRWDDGACALIHLSWLDPGKIRKFTVVGSKKMVVYDDVHPDEKIKVYDKGIDQLCQAYDQPALSGFSYRVGDVFIPKIANNEPLREEIKHFLECIQRNTPCLSGPKEACKVVALLEAGQRSIDLSGKQQIFLADAVCTTA